MEALERVNVPLPTLVRLPVPAIVPAKEVEPVLPVVSVPLPSVTLPPVVPPPAREPMVSFVPFKSKVTPAVLAKVTALPFPKALVDALAPAWRIPPFTVVAPE